jgi:Co/Zn/Cd efflux system component
MERILIYMSVLAAITVCELVIAVASGNVHILKDAMIAALLVAGLWASLKAAQFSIGKPELGGFDYRRVNIIVAFGNCIYVQCTALFQGLESHHHIIEHFGRIVPRISVLLHILTLPT